MRPEDVRRIVWAALPEIPCLLNDSYWLQRLVAEERSGRQRPAEKLAKSRKWEGVRV